MLWIFLYFPQLSLDSLTRGHGEQLLRNLPLVIHDAGTQGSTSRPAIYALNAVARDAGLQAGMSLVAARAVCAELTALPRDTQKEQQALIRLAHWCAQYTPSVTIEANGITLEVSSSLKLFGGIGKLVNALRQGIRQQRFQALIGVAPTPLAALLLARATQYHPATRMCRDATQLKERLADVPLIFFGWSHDVVNTLATLGLTRVKDVLCLPRADLQQRFGDTVVCALDQALGLKGDPRTYVVLPECFVGEHEFLFELIDSVQLIPSTESLLFEMEGFMRARAAATRQVVVTLQHGGKAKTQITLGAREPQRHAKHWLRLLAEKFARAELAAPVIAISLRADTLTPYLAQTSSLLNTNVGVSNKPAEPFANLVDRLAARLGDSAVYQLQVANDHRPELASRVCVQAQINIEAKPQVVRKRLHMQPMQSSTTPLSAQVTPRVSRPSWMLRQPRALSVMQDVPQYHGALTLLAGPERIETGWWDGKPVARDYFVARNQQHEVCWIFRDYRQSRQWFLHGLFA